jgi:hypothetical protein
MYVVHSMNAQYSFVVSDSVTAMSNDYTVGVNPQDLSIQSPYTPSVSLSGSSYDAATQALTSYILQASSVDASDRQVSSDNQVDSL